MVKKIVTACMLMALGSTVYAQDEFVSNTFVGFEIENTKSNSTLQIGNLPKINSKSDAVLEYGIRVGAENDEWRTTLLYTYYYNDQVTGSEETMNKGSLLLDYFFWKTNADALTIKPYLGAHVGYMTYKLTDNQTIPGVNTTIADSAGLFYGLQAGIAVTVSDMIGLDLSYKYSLTNVDFDPIVNTTFELDNMGSIAFSINYFY